MKLEKDELLILKDAMEEYINVFEYSFTPDGSKRVRDVLNKVIKMIAAEEIGVIKEITFTWWGKKKC